MSTAEPEIALVLAIAANGVIGDEGGLPWHLSADLKRFKSLTTGHPIVMGRRTFDSLPRLLPGRPHVVVSRKPGLVLEGATVASSLDGALSQAKRIAADMEVGALFVIGGAQIYAQALAKADVLHVTHVEADVSGDTRLADADFDGFVVVQEERLPADERNDYPTRYVVYRRKAATQAGKR